MKFKELATKPEAELHKMLQEAREQTRDLRFKIASKQLKNVRQMRATKKQIAQIMFLLKQKRAAKTTN